MIGRLYRFLMAHPVDDIVPTDWVRRLGRRGPGCVESVRNDHAVVDWLNGTKEIVSVALLRRVRVRDNQDRRMGE